MGKRGPSTHLFWTLFFSLFLFCGLSRAETKPVGFAVPFADLTFKQTLSKEEQAYLGLPRKTNFSFREIRGNLILVEFLSTYCINCQRQAPVFNELYASIEKDPKLKGKVKMLGIAAGNNLKEAESFKKEYNIPYPILSDPKFDAHTAVGGHRTPFSISVEEVKGKLDLVNFKNIVIDHNEKVLLKKKGMVIDLGGIAKGYAVDKTFEFLKSLGYNNLIVNAGGDLKAGGMRFGQPWTIGIQDPRNPEKIMARISISDTAVATSGDYEKFFIHGDRRYHHILNPRNGFPAEGCQSVTILCKDGMTADALATAVFVLGPEKGYSLCQKMEGVDCLIVDKGGKIILSPGLKDRTSFTP